MSRHVAASRQIGGEVYAVLGTWLIFMFVCLFVCLSQNQTRVTSFIHGCQVLRRQQA